MTNGALGKITTTAGRLPTFVRTSFKDHRTAYLAARERIGYTPDQQSSSNLDDKNVNEPITAEGILNFLTEWFAEDDIVSYILSRPISGLVLTNILLVL